MVTAYRSVERYRYLKIENLSDELTQIPIANFIEELLAKHIKATEITADIEAAKEAMRQRIISNSFPVEDKTESECLLLEKIHVESYLKLLGVQDDKE